MMITAYDDEVHQGKLRPDEAQRAAAQVLDRLQSALMAQDQRSFLARLVQRQPRPQSIYLFGDVGRGKTMLMDLFFASLQLRQKRRVHFHAFMQEVHQRRRDLRTGDVLASIAQSMASETQVLCLDEVQVTDIADAMILGRLFEALLAAGTVIVTTSNLAPGDLYRDGLNRSLFLPTIALIKQRFEVMELAAHEDYRLGRIKAWESFISPLGDKADRHVQDMWERLTETRKGQPLTLDVLGRHLIVPQAAHGCARFTFAELCQQPLGPADYLALTQNFRTVFLEHIPALKPAERNAAKRFVLLIDTLYDARLRLVASASAPPERLYPKGDHKFEFGRTVSRLQEMQSAGWWGQKIAET
jgi:cell division protein ZapE